MQKPPHFFEITPRTWHEAKLIGDLIADYNIFRGQADSKWPLETTLLRSDLLNPNKNPDINDIRIREQQILKRFKSRAHQYIQSPPNDKEYVEWFSLIQDHGGPSRLLDFSESFYVASFFALEAVKEIGCVWAIHQLGLFGGLTNKSNIRDSVIFKIKPIPNKIYHGESELVLRYAESFIEDEIKSEDFVLKVIPPRLNERLAVQKGVFLFPCNINKSFEYNLCRTIKFPFDSLESKNAIQLNYEEFLIERNRIIQTAKQERGSGFHDDLIPVIKLIYLKNLGKMRSMICIE